MSDSQSDSPAPGLPGAARVDTRLYPVRPVVGVGAVVVCERQLVLVRRRFEPLAGHWSLPGGGLEVGETLEAGIAREVLEETGLEVAVGPIIDVFDRITRDLDGRVRYHYVLVDFLCRATGGRLGHGSDVDAAVLADLQALDTYGLTEKALAVAAKGVMLAVEQGWLPGSS